MTRAPKPRPDLVPTSSLGQFQQFPADWVIPHESTSSLRPRPMPGRGRGRGGDLVPTSSLTKHFTASTCRKCSAITIAGTIYGLRVDLEPQVLDDETEYAALADNVPTYNLWPDRVARRRHLEEISRPERVPRHARHTCHHTYGTRPRPTPPAIKHITIDPQF